MNIIRSLSEISADILSTNASLLLLDEATAELMHWQTAQIQEDILPLISNQPQNMRIHILEELLSQIQNEKELSVSLTKEVPVILCSSPLSQTTLMECKRCILERCHTCTIVCQNTASYQQMRDIVWDSTSDVRLLQTHCSNIQIAPDIYLVPAYSTLPATPSDMYYWKGADRPETRQISTSYSLELQVLSEHILSLCDDLGVVTDIFSMGGSSRALAKNLISAIRDREPAEFGKKASLILIDRTLDMVTALSYCGDNLLDRVCGCHSDWCHSSSDVKIDMSRLFCDRYVTPAYAPGSLSQPGNLVAQRLIRSMTTLRTQEVLLELVAALLDGLKERGQKSPLPQRLGRITPTHLTTLLETYRASDMECIARHAGELQLAEACLGCMEGGERSAAWDGMQSREKLLSLFLSQETADSIQQSIMLQLRDIVESSETLQQLLTTLLYVMLASNDTRVRQGVENVMLEEVSKKVEGEGRENFLEGLPEDLKKIARNRASLRLWLDDIIVKFKDLCELQYSTQKPDALYRASAREPVLKELMSALLLSNAKVEELEYHPISFGEGLMSSLGYYMGKSQSFEKKPSSNSMIIVFMLGGITGKEIRCLSDINGLVSKRNHRIIIGSSRLATPARTLASIIDTKHLY